MELELNIKYFSIKDLRAKLMNFITQTEGTKKGFKYQITRKEDFRNV